ncbi:MAG: hypothetical protein U0T81_01195 [Saprospiraceae bacterium]
MARLWAIPIVRIRWRVWKISSGTGSGDANGCESSLLQDNYNCNCGPIFAGELDTLTTTVCQDKCVPIKSILKEIIDPEDIAMYVVHKSSYTSKTDVISIRCIRSMM